MTTDSQKGLSNIILRNANKRHQGKIRINKLNDIWYWKVAFLIFSCLFYTFTAIPYAAGWIWSKISKKPNTVNTPIWWYGNFYCVLGRQIFEPEDLSILESPQTLAHEISHMDYRYFGDGDMADTKEARQELPWYRQWLWVLGYIFIPSKRWDIEKLGYLQNIRWASTFPWNQERRVQFAKFLSGPSYLWMTTEEKALAFINEAFDKAATEEKNGTRLFKLMGSPE